MSGLQVSMAVAGTGAFVFAFAEGKLSKFGEICFFCGLISVLNWLK